MSTASLRQKRLFKGKKRPEAEIRNKNSGHSNVMKSWSVWWISGKRTLRSGERSRLSSSRVPDALIAALSLAFAGCAGVAYDLGNPSMAFAQTPGEYFRRYLTQKHAECEKTGLGPYLPADVGPESRRRANSTCNILFLKPWQPGDSPESAYAHSLQLPSPHDKPVDPYKPGMSPLEYFEALCAKQAGDIIFRKVESVATVVALRPREQESANKNQHLTAFEDTATLAAWQAGVVQALTDSRLYRTVKLKLNGKWSEYMRDLSRGPFAYKSEPIQAPVEGYGFTWRGIADSKLQELGISGGELLVVDIGTKEILGFQRAFRLRWLGRFPEEQRLSVTGFDIGVSCPTGGQKVPESAFQDIRDFLSNVLNPRVSR